MRSEHDWTVGYFDDPYTELVPFPGDERTDAEVGGLLRLLPSPRARVLDVACGQGRHALRLALHGFDVVGVDTSPSFLAAARAAVHDTGAEVTFFELDMRDLSFEEEFDAAINLFTAWGYFDDDTNQQVLVRIANALRPGGALVMELVHRDWLMSVYAPKDWTELSSGSFAVAERSFDPVAGVNTVAHQWRTTDGELHRREHRLRIYTATELDRMLRSAGMRPVEWYGGLSLEPFHRSSPRLAVKAQRLP